MRRASSFSIYISQSALAVRFATKRFIGEYDCTTDRIYRVDNHLGSSWEIADPPGYPPSSAEPKLRWADAIVLVYSVTDRVSFDETSRLRYVISLFVSTSNTVNFATASTGQRFTMRYFSNHLAHQSIGILPIHESTTDRDIRVINMRKGRCATIVITRHILNSTVWNTQNYSSHVSRFLVSHARKGRKVPPVVLLVGNKADLSCSPGERMVSALEGQKRAKEIEAHAFHEISVRESVDQVRTLV